MKILVSGNEALENIYYYGLSQGHSVYRYCDEIKTEIIKFNIIDKRMKNQRNNGILDIEFRDEKEADLVVIAGSELEILEKIRFFNKINQNFDYFLIGHNWTGIENIERIIKRENYILGFSNSGGIMKKNLLWGNLENYISSGQIDNSQNRVYRKVEEIFRKSYILLDKEDNILDFLWVQNIATAPIAKALGKYKNINKFVEDAETVKLGFDSMAEMQEILKNRNVDLGKYLQLQAYSMEFNELYPIFYENMKENPWSKRYFTIMLSNIREYENNFEDIYNYGKSLGIDMENMEKLKKVL